MIQKTVFNLMTGWLPSFQAKVPVQMSIQTKQDPPIEAQGEIIRFTCNCLHIHCENKIPIPSKGTIRFSLGNDPNEIRLNVNFLHRVEKSHLFWFWPLPSRYEISVSLQGNPGDVETKYKKYIHSMYLGENPVRLPQGDVVNA